MKIKNGFVLSKIGNDTVAVATGELSRNFAGVVMLGGCGAFLWEKLTEETDREALVEALLAEYDVDKERASRDVDDFIKKLSDAGILE
ncbi:MAG: PqqD family protein [Clostridia bacterium]|nr:PqqD family protein [Clostridia bacterium]